MSLSMFASLDFSISTSIFLYLFGAYLTFYLLYSLFTVFHLLKYGVYNFSLYLLITVFAGGTILLVSGSLFYLSGFDWSTPIPMYQVLQEENSGLFPNL